jgi:hypothetical protein
VGAHLPTPGYWKEGEPLVGAGRGVRERHPHRGREQSGQLKSGHIVSGTDKIIVIKKTKLSHLPFPFPVVQKRIRASITKTREGQQREQDQSSC